MRIERELMRGAGPVAVLKLLEGGEMYGYELAATLDARSKGVLNLGQRTLYPLLYNLEAKGLITSDWRTVPTKDADAGGGGAGGRERRYYRLKGAGRERLATDSAQWQSVTGAMASIRVINLAGFNGGAA